MEMSSLRDPAALLHPLHVCRKERFATRVLGPGLALAVRPAGAVEDPGLDG